MSTTIYESYYIRLYKDFHIASNSRMKTYVCIYIHVYILNILFTLRMLRAQTMRAAE
jgi:hypothetical protein